MSRKTLYQTLVIVMALAFVGTGLAYGQPCVLTSDGSGTQCFTLVAGQSTNAGTVCVTVDGANLEVIYTTTGGWTLCEAQLWVGQNIADLPQTKIGNPVPGRFPHKSGMLCQNQTTFTFSIPLTNPEINFSCPSDDVIYYMAAHAALQKHQDEGTYYTETGWSEGSPITSRGNWATFSTFTLTCDCAGRPEATCETAFAKVVDHTHMSTCFIDLGFQRWGWTNGPLSPGTPATYTFDIWAGAGQCDTNKGALAGTLSVAYDGNEATVTYTMNGDWYLNETHLYVGNAPLPTYRQGKRLVETVAPGKYPYIHENLDMATTDTYIVPISGDIYVVAHAVTCIAPSP